jgi:NitT/TauT family transport system permease protein
VKVARRVVPVVAAVVILVLAWEIAGRTRIAGAAFPPFSGVIATLFDPAKAALFGRAAGSTGISAAVGLLIGAALAMAIAAVRQAIRPSRPGLDRFAAFVHSLPELAIAPALAVVIGRENAPIAVAAIAVFFPAYAASTRAFGAASAVHQELFTVLGSPRRSRLFRLELPAAVTGLADALRLAAPAAVLGAAFGEWFGASRGVGILILSASQNFNVLLLWAAALLATLMTMAGYAVFGILHRLALRRFA